MIGSALKTDSDELSVSHSLVGCYVSPKLSMLSAEGLLSSLLGWRSCTGLSDADVSQLQRVVDEQVHENLGMAMIYAVVAAAQEWLRDKVLSSPPRPPFPAAYLAT